jgi:hypothetical protein
MDRRKLLTGAAALAASAVLRQPQADTLIAPGLSHIPANLHNWRRPLTNSLTIRPVANAARHTGSNGVTVGSNFPCPVRPRWVRAVFFNDQSTPWTVTGSSVAVSSRLNSKNGTSDTAFNAAGNPDGTLWNPLTFNNGGSFAYTPATQLSGSTTSIEVPAVTNVAQPSMVASDWVAISVAPANSAAGPAYNIFHRAYAGASAPTYFCQAGTAPLASLNLNYGGFYASGDHASTSQNTTGAALALQSCYGLQVIGDRPCGTIMTVGDSVQSGQGTTGYDSGMAPVTAITLQQQTGFPASFLAESVSGRMNVNFIPDGRNDMADLLPDIAFIQVISLNDLSRSSEQSTIDACTGRALALADYVFSLGKVPVLLTAVPYYSGAAGRLKFPGEVLRQASNTYVRSLGAKGMLIVDLDALVSTAPNSGVYADGLCHPDLLHPNDAGTAVCVNGTPAYPGYLSACKFVFGV